MSENKALLMIVNSDQVTVTVSSGLHNCTEYFLGQSLQALMESACADEGDIAMALDVTIPITLWSHRYFTFTTLLVQTAAAISSGSTDSSLVKLEEILDPGIDDVFGYRILGYPRGSPMFMEIWNGTSFVQLYKTSLVIKLSKNILKIINKTSETERLQSLYLLLYLRGTTNGQEIFYNYSSIIKYRQERKGISIR